MTYKFKLLVAAFIYVATVSVATAQDEFLSIEPIQLDIPYQTISSLGKYRYDSLSYLEAQHQTDYIYEYFTYQSDGFKVEGYSCRPKNPTQHVPLIIYNRGGTGNYGKLTKEDLPDFYWLAKHGFAVYASNYRFIGELGPIDQSGGADVNDVIRLTQIAKHLPFTDPQNIFIMGVSRGGGMTYQSTRKMNYNAAVVIAGVSDLRKHAAYRPIFLEGWSDLEDELNYKGLANILPDFDERKEEYFDQRSAVVWADQINTPLLLLHSRQDGLVLADNAISMANELQKQKKPYKLKIYDERSHGLPYSKFDSFEEIIDWFNKHKQ